MAEARVLLGTSAWTADGWVGSFYPPRAKPQDFLPIYAERFQTVEIDSTFYRIPTTKMVEQWRERTPDGFVYAAKIPQTITHEKVLVDAEDELKAFVKVMDILGDKLGPLLFQFPYFNKQKFRGVGFFLERLEPWLDKLPKGYQWTVVVRNKNWLSEKLYSVLRRHGVALALVDHVWMPRPKEWFETGDPITANFTYVRWIGDRKGIEMQTKVWNETIIDRTEDLREWAEVLRNVSRRVRLIYGYANNHWAGFAPDTVEGFRKIWGATAEQASTTRKAAQSSDTNTMSLFPKS
jgi:uncharacterized protein YecE (DUF72 family)